MTSLVGRGEAPKDFGERLKREHIFRSHTVKLVKAIREYEVDPKWAHADGKMFLAADSAERALRLENIVDLVDIA